MAEGDAGADAPVPGHRLLPRAPDAAAYCELRRVAGLTPKTLRQATAAIAGSWAACHLVHDATGVPVAMGRVIGDGGWYFHLADIATHPDHQRRGLGSAVMNWLLGTIDEAVVEPAYVTLLADPPGRPLYERFGFRPTAPAQIGMRLASVTRR